MDPAVGNDLLPPPSSPSISSVSSSDLDTESTGSFFHDRSTTLGTLMGVTFPTIAFRTPSHSHPPAISGENPVGVGARRTKKKKRRGVVRWWRLCRDDVSRSASLGEFLEVERNEFYGASVEYEGVMPPPTTTAVQGGGGNNYGGGGGGRVLFADGRVLPPAPRVEESPSTVNAVCRCPLPGICSGGD